MCGIKSLHCSIANTHYAAPNTPFSYSKLHPGNTGELCYYNILVVNASHYVASKGEWKGKSILKTDALWGKIYVTLLKGKHPEADKNSNII